MEATSTFTGPSQRHGLTGWQDGHQRQQRTLITQEKVRVKNKRKKKIKIHITITLFQSTATAILANQLFLGNAVPQKLCLL